MRAPSAPLQVLQLEARRTLRDGRELARKRAMSMLGHRRIPALPLDCVVPLEEATDVLVLCSDSIWESNPQTYAQESAFAFEMTRRGRKFALAEEPDAVFDKNVMWFLPWMLVRPRLWDYSLQAQQFVEGLERQGNRVFCSSNEMAFWENKVHMHACLDRIEAATPPTQILSAGSWESADFSVEPVLIKIEHSSGSQGIFHFATGAQARQFVAGYDFKPTESLIMQQVVPGATRDMRLTIVGDAAIVGATYWRTKSEEALAREEWTTTATTYQSRVTHELPPAEVVESVADVLRQLDVRTAGVDLMWVNDDLQEPPLILEFSPYYQANPPKPERYAGVSYKTFKNKWWAKEGYLEQQYHVFREIAGQILDQGLF